MTGTTYVDLLGGMVRAEPGGCGVCHAPLEHGQCVNPAHPFGPGEGADHRARRQGLGLAATALDLLIESDAAPVDRAARTHAADRLVDELPCVLAALGCPDHLPGWDDRVVAAGNRRAREDGLLATEGRAA